MPEDQTIVFEAPKARLGMTMAEEVEEVEEVEKTKVFDDEEDDELVGSVPQLTKRRPKRDKPENKRGNLIMALFYYQWASAEAFMQERKRVRK